MIMKSLFTRNNIKLIFIAAIVIFVVLVMSDKIRLKERFQTAPTSAAVPGASNLVLADASGNLSSIEFPSRLIMIWSPPAGWNGQAPSGWALCDGTNGTPDLRGRFVVGATNGTTSATTLSTSLTAKTPGTMGGAEKVALSINEMPRHTHQIGGGYYSFVNGSGYGAFSNSNDAYAFSRNPNYTSFSGGPAGAANQEGPGQAHENMPPFYALVYIMKL